MYISSYSMYINNQHSSKTDKTKESETTKQTERFASLLQTPSHTTFSDLNIKPIDYIFSPQKQQTQQRLILQQNEIKDDEEISKSMQTLSFVKKFSLIANNNKALLSYINNSKSYSLMRKPKAPLNQIKIPLNTTEKFTQAREEAMRHTMINTYLANDKYYKITA